MSESKHPDSRPLGEKLGVRVVRGLFNQPSWRFGLDMFLIVIGVMWMNDLLFVHGRILHPNEQWMSAQFDLALILAGTILHAMLKQQDVWSHFPAWLRDWRVHAVLPVAGLLVGGVHVLDELPSLPKGSVGGMNWFYHNSFLYPFLSYVLGLLVLAIVWQIIRHGAWRELYVLVRLAVIAACIYGWLWAGGYDATHQFAPGGVSKHLLANPPDSWWGNGLVPQGAEWLWAWAQEWLRAHITPLFS